MKLHALLVLTALLFVSSINNVSIAQVQTSEVKTNLPENTFYFYFINGYALAYKFYNSGNSDLRLRIDLSSSYSDTKGSRDYESGSMTDKRVNENNSTNSSNYVSAEFAYSYNFYKSHLGQAYAGTGPFISYNRRKQVNSDKDFYSPLNGSISTNTDFSYGFSAGLSAFAGLEAFFCQSIRVFAETQLTGGRNWNKSENYYENSPLSNYTKTTSGSTGTYSSWFYNLTSVRVGLGISI
ncbi:MAG: hypothetical protein ACM3S2_17370 [Ignavibacteriales bacterium]